MTETTARRKRPTAITVVCVLSLLGGLIAVALVATDLAGFRDLLGAVSALYPWYPLYLGGSVAIGLISLVGIWRMKLWALKLYAAMFIIGQLISVLMGAWSPISMAIPLIFLVIVAKYRGEMD